jgi:hypothetical protein
MPSEHLKNWAQTRLCDDSEDDAPEDELADVRQTVAEGRLEAVLHDLGEREGGEAGLPGDAAVKRGLRVLVVVVI